MTLSVIGAGFGRTGTKSLKLALERLGFGPCHHMEEGFQNPDQLLRWRAAIDGGEVNWDEVLAGYSSCTDYPSSYFWRELAETYPEAKVVLTMRSVESWWESYSNTIMIALQNIPEDAPAHVREVREMAAMMWREKTFAAPLDDKVAAFAAYERYVDDVVQSITDDRLLCFDVRDGWAPLCEFLGRPIPDEDFPRTNNASEFHKNR